MKTRRRAAGVVLVAAAVAGCVSLAHAADDSPSPCASVTDDRSRLQCYDAQEALKKQRAGTAPARAPETSPTREPVAAAAPKVPSQAATPGRSSAPSSESNAFGSETLPRAAPENSGRSDGPEELVARVTSVSGRRKGDYRIALDNGQVWMETQRTGGDPPEVGEEVTLKRGALGSYFLSRGSGLALRVKRIQ